MFYFFGRDLFFLILLFFCFSFESRTLEENRKGNSQQPIAARKVGKLHCTDNSPTTFLSSSQLESFTASSRIQHLHSSSISILPSTAASAINQNQNKHPQHQKHQQQHLQPTSCSSSSSQTTINNAHIATYCTVSYLFNKQPNKQ